ncbi:DNA polymerase III subunit epsilon [Psychrobacter jeotgali]|uniref:DNA polymerase III subunit epsilon n=1 Tax=Psychrobacter jeotgali TaxID=179010 RepID=UPI00191A96CE|nr:DNA polymerase III subunit epsilon [Psychrobacter jeotgali]
MSDNVTDPMAAKKNTTIAYTDGACKGNPGAGGWGAHLIFSDGHTQDLYGGEAETTNNRMELMGAIQALQHSSPEVTLEIWTDSSYVKNGITDWIEGWKKRGWKTASKKPVANQDLWQQLDELCQGRKVDWHWVKGHAGHAGNEKADELANLGVTSSSASNNATLSKDNNDLMAKKKPHLTSNDDLPAAEAVDNDWLFSDPLGLDAFDNELDDELDDGLLAENAINERLLDSAVIDTIDSSRNNNSTNANPHNSSPPIASRSSDNMAINNSVENSLINDAAIDSDTAVDAPKFDGDTSRANPHFQPLLPQPIHKNEANRQLIMDTETTGLDALKGDRIIEVGIVELIGRKFTGEKLHVYINPQRGMDEEVIRIHGISEAFLADKPTFDQVAQSLYDFMDGAEIIAHNATFDMNFLSMEFGKVGMTDFAQRVKVTDSLAMAKQQYPGQKNTLDALVRRLDVGKQDRTFHGALLDSEILAEVYLAMTGGQVALAIEEDVQTEGGQTAHANFAELASLLLASKADRSANEQWFTSLADDYPDITAKLSDW